MRHRAAFAVALAALASAACASVLGLQNLTGPEADDGGTSEDGAPSRDGATETYDAGDSSLGGNAEDSSTSAGSEAGDAATREDADSSASGSNDGSLPESGDDAGDASDAAIRVDSASGATFGTPCTTGGASCPSDYSFCGPQGCTKTCDTSTCPNPTEAPCTAQCPDPPTNGYCGGTGGTSYCL